MQICTDRTAANARYLSRDETPLSGRQSSEWHQNAQLTVRMDWAPADSRRRCRSKKTWRDTFCEDIQARGVSWSEVEVTKGRACTQTCWPLFRNGLRDLSAE